jgi:transcriptional regulator with XRE-family HTH domain
MNSLKAVSRVALLREKIGLTQLELAQFLDVTENTIANWERGRSGIEWFVRIATLCKIFQCHPEDLFEYISCESDEISNKKESILEEIRRSLGTTKQAKTRTKISTSIEA